MVLVASMFRTILHSFAPGRHLVELQVGERRNRPHPMLGGGGSVCANVQARVSD
jgi:hypothetical protein